MEPIDDIFELKNLETTRKNLFDCTLVVSLSEIERSNRFIEGSSFVKHWGGLIPMSNIGFLSQSSFLSVLVIVSNSQFLPFFLFKLFFDSLLNDFSLLLLLLLLFDSFQFINDYILFIILWTNESIKKIW